MKILCLGDSLTYGYGVARKDCWVSLSAERTGHRLVNRGINGDTTAGMLARLSTEMLPEHPDRLFLLGGTNDILFTGSFESARSNVAAIIHQAISRGIRPMLGLPTPFYPLRVPAPWSELADASALLPVFLAYRSWLLEFARIFEVQVVDFSLPGLVEDLFPDGLHPNAQGHRLMADAFCNALPPLLL